MIVGVIQLIDSHFNFTAIAGKTLWFIERNHEDDLLVSSVWINDFSLSI